MRTCILIKIFMGAQWFWQFFRNNLQRIVISKFTILLRIREPSSKWGKKNIKLAWSKRTSLQNLWEQVKYRCTSHFHLNHIMAQFNKLKKTKIGTQLTMIKIWNYMLWLFTQMVKYGHKYGTVSKQTIQLFWKMCMDRFVTRSISDVSKDIKRRYMIRTQHTCVSIIWGCSTYPHQ